MGISTGKINRKTKTAELLEFHKDKIKANQISNPLFIPKCAYQPSGMEGLHLGFFESELKRGAGADIYTEFVSIDLDPEDPDRNLYKLRYNPHYAEEYVTTEPNSNGHVRYLIPVDELIKIEYPEIIEEDNEEYPSSLFPDFELMDPDKDAPLNRMTIKDLFAVMHKKPVSDKKWLNDLINKS